jgi:uncharacterized membrane-anchored protein YjiN (DUF445 family)
MSVLEDLKCVIDDMNVRKLEFHRHLAEYQAMQRNIRDLADRAKSDPAAAQKLQKVNRELQKVGVVQQRVDSVVTQLKLIEQQLREMEVRRSGFHTGRHADTKRAAPKRVRQFI